MVLHFANHMHQLLVADAIARCHLHALVILAGAYAAQHELLGNLNRELRAVGMGDQVEHQVDRGRAAGRGDAPTIDFE
ncbi:hypothetical protein D3C86_2070680 [compost metagenome]